MASNVLKGPLDGVRVLDLTRVVAGPLATRILADQGAEVIKIEPPEGDLSRTFPPLRSDGVTPYFAQQNAGKHFCSLDLAKEGASELVVDLLASCDVLVENFRPGVMARLGLDPDEICARFPRLIFCSITGFGQDGPWVDRRAYAPIGHLESGFLEYDQRKINRVPHQPALVLGDATTALMAASSINAALVRAARTGEGGRLDVCMVESLVYIQEWVSTELAGGWETTNAGACEQTPILTLPDGRVWGLAGNIVAWFDQLVEAMDRTDLLADPRFAEPEARESNRSAIEQLVTEWAASFEHFDDFRIALESRSPFTTAELRSIHELGETEWAAHRELFVETDAGFDVPARSAVGLGIGTNGHVGARGADNRAVLSDMFGLDDQTIDSFQAAGIVIADG